MSGILFGQRSADRPSRKRLASNVLCMFADERPAIVNPPHRGRYGGNITPAAEMRRRAREKLEAREQRPLAIGEVVEIFGDAAFPVNNGLRVELCKQYPTSERSAESWFVRAVDKRIESDDRSVTFTSVHASMLRRPVAAPVITLFALNSI